MSKQHVNQWWFLAKATTTLIWKANNVVWSLVKNKVLKALGRGLISHPSPNSHVKTADSSEKQLASAQNQSTCSQTRGPSQESASTEKVGHEKYVFGPVQWIELDVNTRSPNSKESSWIAEVVPWSPWTPSWRCIIECDLGWPCYMLDGLLGSFTFASIM